MTIEELETMVSEMKKTLAEAITANEDLNNKIETLEKTHSEFKESTEKFQSETKTSYDKAINHILEKPADKAEEKTEEKEPTYDVYTGLFTDKKGE